MGHYLVPFNFHAFHTSEAIWDMSKKDMLKMFRMTRKGWGEFFRAKNPQTYIDKLKHKLPHLPEGIPSTVEGMTGQKYLVFALDIFEGFEYATYSDLPDAKKFVRKFPELLMAFMERKIIPPAIGDIKGEVLLYFNIPYPEKKAYREKTLKEFGWHRTKFFRELDRTKRVLGIPPEPTKATGEPRKTRADKGKSLMPEEVQKIIDTFTANPGITKKDIYKLSGTKYSYGHVNMILRGQKTVH